MTIKEAMKEFKLSKELIKKYLSENDIDKSSTRSYKIKESGLKKLNDLKTKYVKQSEFITQGIFTKNQIDKSELLRKHRKFNLKGTIGWLYLREDFERIKNDLEERKRLYKSK